VNKLFCGLIIFLMLLGPAVPSLFAAAVQVDFLLSGMTDTSGEMLAGGLVYTYVAGTTSVKTTWTDSAKSAAAPNPVVLDAYGRANIYADGTYKFVIRTSEGVLLYTLDNLEYVSSVSPSSISVTSATITGATIASLTASSFTLSGGLMSNSTLSNSTVNAPEITNASMSGSVLHTSTLNAPTITNPNISGGGSVATPTASTEPVNKGYVDGILDGSVGAGIATPTASNQAANKGYVDNKFIEYAAGTLAVYSPLAISSFDYDYTTIVGTDTKTFAYGTNVDSFNLVNVTNSTGTYVFYVTYSVRAASYTAGPLECQTWLHDGSMVYDGMIHFANATIATYTSGGSPLPITAPGYANGSLVGISEVSPLSVKTIYLRGNQYLNRPGNDAVFALSKTASWFKYYRIK